MAERDRGMGRDPVRGSSRWAQPDEGRSGAYQGETGRSAGGEGRSEGPREGGEAAWRNRGPKGWQRTDERIHEDVCERMMGESGIDPSDVTVQVSQGTVVLTGTVPNRQMKYRIEELADRCPGVTEVENRVRVNRAGAADTSRGSSRGSLLGRLFGFSSGAKVSEVMTRAPQVVSPEDPIKRVAQMMKEHDVGAMPVCNGRELVGMVTDRDIAIRAVAEGKPADSAKVTDVMTSKVHWCFEDDDIDDVLERMGDLQVRRIPVVDRSKHLVGIVALGDLSRQEAGEVQDTLQEISERR